MFTNVHYKTLCSVQKSTTTTILHWQVTIPLTGARLIIGSDGLWDALPAKQAAHAVRSLPAGQAASQLVYQVCGFCMAE